MHYNKKIKYARCAGWDANMWAGSLHSDFSPQVCAPYLKVMHLEEEIMSIRDELKEEYLFLQQTYEDFDNRALLIKGWAITVSLGSLALGFNPDNKDFFGPIFLFVSISSILFWVIEAKWKTFQYANAYRIRILEAYFRGDEKYQDIIPFQIYHSWFKAYSQDPPVHEYEKNNISKTPLSQTLSNAMLPLVFMPYLPITLAGLIGFAIYA